MPTITKSIGTASRDYSTITLWEADLDNGAVYASGDAAVGECYNDSAFDESVTIDGGGTVGLASVTLTVAAGERHDGTAGTGARIVKSAGFSTFLLDLAILNTKALWLELDGNGQTGTSTGLGRVATALCEFRNVLCHDLVQGTSPAIVLGGTHNIAGGGNRILNSIVYACSHGSRGAISGIGCAQSRVYHFANCTVHNISGNHGTEIPACFKVSASSASHTFQNCLGTAASNAGAGGASDFITLAATVVDHNASGDTSAVGTGSLASIDPADQYVSTVVGSEDLHLKSGADCIDAGVDLGTTPTGVNIDINGRDRDAEGDVWDIGAHEFVAAAAAGNPWYYYAQQ